MKIATVWVLAIVAAGMFLFAGTLKLAGAAIEVQLFDAIGIGQWFRYVTGSLEVMSAIGLFVPPLAPAAATLLAAVMVGAITTHLFIVGGSPIPAIALLAITIAITYLRRERISSAIAVA